MKLHTFISAILGASAVLLPSLDASAQTEYKWEQIDCAQSRIVAPTTGLSCRATNVVTGGDTIGGMFKRWSVAAPNSPDYMHYSLWEGLDMRSHIRVTETLPEYLKWMNTRAQSGTQFSGAGRYKDSDYLTFRNKESQPCVGFRRLGESRGAGYSWIMGGMKCWSGQRDVTPEQIVQFIDQGQLR